jgi:hypothetical protein
LSAADDVNGRPFGRTPPEGLTCPVAGRQTLIRV